MSDFKYVERQDKVSEEEDVIKDYLNTDIAYRTDSGNAAFYDSCFEWIKVKSGK